MKSTMEGLVNSIWKEYGNYNMSLLKQEKTVLPDTNARHDLYAFALLRLDFVKKQDTYCFLPFGFINRSSWFESRYFNFEQSLKLWWRLARDFDGSQILVTSRGFQGFWRRFLGFEISKLRVFVCVAILTIISNMNYCFKITVRVS